MTSLHPVEVFPYGTTPTRTADLDHTQPHRQPGPPGQTRRGNLGPLSRHHHRAKTFGGFTCHQPLPGLYLWRTPTGHWYQVDHTGTHHLGRTTPEILDPLTGRTTDRPPSSRMEAALRDIQLDFAPAN